jgi:hypothetical protein
MLPSLTVSRASRVRRSALAAVSLSAVALSLAVGPALAATGFAATVVGGVLQVRGGSAAEQIVLRLAAGEPNQLEVLVTGAPGDHATFSLDTFRAIAVDAGNGADEVVIDQTNGIFTTIKPTSIAGGNGDDTLRGGSGVETFHGGRGNDVVDGNGGADTAFLDQGDDVFIWDPGDASDVVEGGAGSDTMVFNGAPGNEIMAATASGGRVLFTRNLGGIVMDLDDVEAIDVRALGGADTVTIGSASGTDLRRVDVDLAGTLGGASSDTVADSVTVEGTAGSDSITASAEAGAVEVTGLAASVRVKSADADRDRLVIDTGAGNDTVAVDPDVEGLMLVTVQ